MAMSRLVCVGDYEQYAEHNLPNAVRQYFNSGANYEQTYADNVAAFKRYRFRPRYMRDMSERNLTTSLLGHDVTSPIGVSPMSMCRLAHPDGEVALAKACESEGSCFCLSMAATSSVEEVGQAAPGCTRWFQVHVLKDRDMMRRMVQRAQRAGFTALVLTVDCAVHGKRYKDLRNQFSLPPHLKLSNFEEELKRAKSVVATGQSKEEWGRFVNQAFSPAHTWQDIQWLKSVSHLPVVAKGVVTAWDALEAVQHGADAVWVSNHGGRELDCLPATIDALTEVCQAVGDKTEVYLDGGVRSGLDILKALSRGARAVYCGRPALWGLAKDGEAGTSDVLQILKEELSVGMALAGIHTYLKTTATCS
ncbi:2-Hydroxyacid oxidase 1-like isoform X2 [Littorina saxatilis]|uniref:2-Hydroxyacid oxidase 1-like isoform X2 n=1 Tax=Littorina saxatilis TaxID=31220 RepID=UPI0038B66A8B